MRLLIATGLLWQLVTSAVWANTLSLSPASIDTGVLDNKRLFFNEAQRQGGQVVADRQNLAKQSNKFENTSGHASHSSITRPESDAVLQYTGVVHSERGVQILLNGVPWQPGQLAIVSARLQADTQLVEIEMDNGVQYRLMPGDAIELRP